MSKPATETWKVAEARDRRAKKLAAAVIEWQLLAAQHRYPRSLQEIICGALKREYALGMLRARR